MICPFCKEEIVDGAIKCKHCGSMLNQSTPQETQATNVSNFANTANQNFDNISKTENAMLMQKARESLKGYWGLAIGTLIVYGLVTGAIQIIPLIGTLASLLITGAMTTGYCIFNLSISRKQNPKLSQIFEGFNKFGTSLGAYILSVIFIILWMLLLIIPGIIAALSYSMIYFIIADNDNIGPLEAITKSKELMKGNKWKFFCLGCRFIGWCILGVLTMGIGFLWIAPYMGVSFAKFYEDIIKKHAL